MLIVYRTNPGFEGEIASIDRDMTPAAMDLWLAEDEQRSQDTAYLYLDERLLNYELLSRLIAKPSDYAVDPITRQLVRDGEPVDLGYTPGVADAAMAALRSDPDVVALVGMDDTNLLAWIESKTSDELFKILFRTLRNVMLATALSS